MRYSWNGSIGAGSLPFLLTVASWASKFEKLIANWASNFKHFIASWASNFSKLIAQIFVYLPNLKLQQLSI